MPYPGGLDLSASLSTSDQSQVTGTFTSAWLPGAEYGPGGPERQGRSTGDFGGVQDGPRPLLPWPADVVGAAR